MSENALEITDKNFAEVVKASPEPVLVDFFADWCPPCQQLAPIIDELAAEADGFKVGKIDVEANPAMAQQFKVTGIPTLLVFRDGEETGRTIGLQSKEALKSFVAGSDE